MKNIIIILFLLALTLSCGKKGDPVYKGNIGVENIYKA